MLLCAATPIVFLLSAAKLTKNADRLGMNSIGRGIIAEEELCRSALLSHIADCCQGRDWLRWHLTELTDYLLLYDGNLYSQPGGLSCFRGCSSFSCLALMLLFEQWEENIWLIKVRPRLIAVYRFIKLQPLFAELLVFWLMRLTSSTNDYLPVISLLEEKDLL